MNQVRHKQKNDWEACTAEGARNDVLEQFRAMTLREKVEWLDEAEQVALRFRIPTQQPDRQPEA